MKLRGVIVVEDAVDEWADGRSRAVPAVAHVANRPVADHVLDALEEVGVDEIVVASSAQSAPIIRECLATLPDSRRSHLEFVECAQPAELPSALSLVASIVGDDPCIVHAACGLLAEPLSPLADHLDRGADVVLAVHQAADPDVRLSARVQRLLRLAELDPTRPTLGMAGVWAFGPGVLRRVVGRDDERVDVTRLVERIIEDRGRIEVRVADAWHAYRGDPLDLLELNRLVLERITHSAPVVTGEDNRIIGHVRIDESASVRSSVLVGPVVVGPNAQITDAYLGPCTAVGAGAFIEGTEIERSIVCGGARLSHVGRRLTDSVIGPNARVFRDFSLPRALRLRLDEGTEVGLCW
jgi:glucose-1-phosphate thymidylyltransferase